MANNLVLGLVIGASLKGSFSAAFGKANKTIENLSGSLGKATKMHDRMGASITKMQAKQVSLHQKIQLAYLSGDKSLGRLTRRYEKMQSQITQLVAKQQRFTSAIQTSENHFVNSWIYFDSSASVRTANETRPRNRPCAFAVDRQASTYIVYFDNGCTLPIPPTYSRIYPYAPHKGEPYGATAGTPSEYDPILTIMWLSRGLITMADLSGLNGISRFVGADWVVQNPVQDPAQFNWSKAMFNPADTSGPSKRGQPFFIRTLFALGVINEQTALELGAVKV